MSNLKEVPKILRPLLDPERAKKWDVAVIHIFGIQPIGIDLETKISFEEDILNISSAAPHPWLGPAPDQDPKTYRPHMGVLNMNIHEKDIIKVDTWKGSKLITKDSQPATAPGLIKVP